MSKIKRQFRGAKTAVIAIVAFLLLTSMSVPSLADLRIISEDAGERFEILMKGNRIASPIDDEGGRLILFCESEQVIFVSPANQRKYWQGTVAEFTDALQVAFDELLSPLDDVPGLGGLLGGLFGGSAKPKEIQVRIRQMGSETINGYQTTQYRVETNEGNAWETHEDLWLSDALMREVKSEVGDCVLLSLDLGDQLTALAPMGMDTLRAVLKDPEYKALLEKGYPVRTHTRLQMFGMNMDTVSEVVEVNRDAISDNVFSVPAGYSRVNNPVELFGL